MSARRRRLLSIAHASTAASRIGPRIVMKPHSMMCLLSPLDTGSTGGGGEGCMGTWATIVRAGDADGRYQSFDPPCGAAIGRWQRAALTAGPMARCRPPPPPPQAVDPLPPASRPAGRLGGPSCRDSVWQYG